MSKDDDGGPSDLLAAAQMSDVPADQGGSFSPADLAISAAAKEKWQESYALARNASAHALELAAFDDALTEALEKTSSSEKTSEGAIEQALLRALKARSQASAQSVDTQ